MGVELCGTGETLGIGPDTPQHAMGWAVATDGAGWTPFYWLPAAGGRHGESWMKEKAATRKPGRGNPLLRM